MCKKIWEGPEKKEGAMRKKVGWGAREGQGWDNTKNDNDSQGWKPKKKLVVH